jgi:hypothetical protein
VTNHFLAVKFLWMAYQDNANLVITQQLLPTIHINLNTLTSKLTRNSLYYCEIM